MQILSAPPAGAVAVRALPELQTESVLRSILQSIDHGVLLTDLEHRSLACNRRFGEIFGIEPSEVVQMDVDDLRDRVVALFADPEGWRESLRRVYTDPEGKYEDEIVFHNGTAIRRVTSPVRDADGHIFGRLWTFTDVTDAHRRRRNSDLLRRVSTLCDPDPGINLRDICQALTDHFGSATQLNILEGDFLRFHLNAGDMGPAQSLPGIMRWDTYCGFTLVDDKPLLVQDALIDSRCSGLLPASVGFCRYLGVPVRDETGLAIGTLCIVDQHVDKPLGAADIELMELVAMRANAELARERYLAEKIAEGERRFEIGRKELDETRTVLGGMNDAFALLFEVRGTAELLCGLASRLRNVLGYEASAVYLRRPNAPTIDVAAWPAGASRHSTFEAGEFPPGAECGSADGSLDVRFSNVSGEEVGRLLGQPWAAFGCLPGGEWGEAVVVLGRSDVPPSDDPRHSVQLSALMDGVRLVLAAHALNGELAQKNVALQAAQEKVLRSEKLAVVGTLAAATAHDIRNITASLSLLARDADDPAASLAAVREQLDRFNVLAHRLLSYARPGQVARNPVCVDELLERALGLTAGQSRVSRVNAELVVDENLPTILGDERQLQHLFVNLVLNAIQAMDRTGGSLRVEARSEPGGVAVHVIDDGPGIPDGVAGRLFQPFASSRPQGFGLGLFSARRIAEDHGGSIAARRNSERGTTFVVTLPLERGESA